MTEPLHARSALNLRAVLAAFGFVACGGLSAAAFLTLGGGIGTVIGVILAVLAFIALIDEIVVQRRRSARRRAGVKSEGLFS